MIRVYQGPSFTCLNLAYLLVNEVASLAIVAVAFFSEGMASFCLIGSIMFHVDPQLFRPMSELTLLPICAVPFFNEIFAERSFGFGACPFRGGFVGGVKVDIMEEIVLFAFSGGLAFKVE